MSNPSNPGDTRSSPPVDTCDFVLGALVRWGPREQLGVIEGLQGDGDGDAAEIGFDDGTKKIIKTEAGVLERVRLAVGDRVVRDGGPPGVIIGQGSSGDYPTWEVSFPEGISNVAEIGLRPALVQDPVDRMRRSLLGSAEAFNLRATAADYWYSNEHSPLVSLSHARVDLKPHQVSVVHRVTSNYPYRFMLCDEVGLGKTIEAAMIIKELRARGQANRVLVIVPPGLIRQWQYELKTKFNEPFAIFNTATLRHLKDEGVANPWMSKESVIVSHTWASAGSDRRQEIADVPWDMVVVDEAHHARARKDGSTTRTTNLYALVSDLIARPEAARRGALLLTATPLQLEHYELYSLCDMLNPILFASEDDFSEHMSSLEGLNHLAERLEKGSLPTNLQELAELEEDAEHFLDLEEGAARELMQADPRELAEQLKSLHRVSEVLIRNRKSVVGGFQPRTAVTWDVELSEHERRVHDLMDEVLERGWARAAGTGQNTVGFQMVILQKLLASSSRALLTSLTKRRDRLVSGARAEIGELEAESALEDDSDAGEVVEAMAGAASQEASEFDEVITELKAIRLDMKAKILRANLKKLFEDEPDGKVIIFTEFRETQAMLESLLSAIGTVELFHGRLKPEQKDAAVKSFRVGSGPRMLVSTEAGGEGRNFQFCHYIVNYDLPWNPMKVEQRIGRLDRIGQEHPVVIFNFHVRGTIEGRILEVLERRINIFEDTVGGLDPILGDAEADIRTAVKLAAHERDAAIDRIGLRLEQDVERARQAEKLAADFIMDAKSFVAEIVATAAGTQSPISQDEFEKFEIALLKSANTYIGPREENGERRIYFHVPFTLEHPELVAGQEARRVCFDPHVNPDSELVEYLGFGHPIIDALVRRTLDQHLDGSAAVRRVDGAELGIGSPGWLFNWILTVGGLSSRRFVLPVFVPDGSDADYDAGMKLLKSSRAFAPEDVKGNPPLEKLEDAHARAQAFVKKRHDEELAEAQREAAAGLEDTTGAHARPLRSACQRRPGPDRRLLCHPGPLGGVRRRPASASDSALAGESDAGASRARDDSQRSGTRTGCTLKADGADGRVLASEPCPDRARDTRRANDATAP